MSIADRSLPNENQVSWHQPGSRETALVGDAGLEFEWLFADEFPAVMRSVFLIVHDLDRAEDITQDAFVQLLRHWKKVSRYDRPGAWVRRVAIRLGVQAVRRERLRSLLERNVEPAAPPGTTSVDVMNAIDRLPARQKAAVVLFYFEDRPLVEIADLLQCSDATARVHLHRARKRLAAILGEGVIEDAP